MVSVAASTSVEPPCAVGDQPWTVKGISVLARYPRVLILTALHGLGARGRVSGGSTIRGSETAKEATKRPRDAEKQWEATRTIEK